MSVSWGTQYDKLKTNLRLSINRLRLLQKKKTEMALKSRTEIAQYLSTDKEDRARIKVESIIREDFVVEAYELLEMFCELLLARFGLIQQMKELDDGIAEAVSSLLWVAPRISHEIAEFKVISDQLTQKYGKQFAEAARMNQLPEPSRVSPKLIQKLSVSAPSKLLVEKYLVEIARAGGVDFTPDPKLLRDDDDELATAERNLLCFMTEGQIGWRNAPPKNSGGDGGGGGTASPYPSGVGGASTYPSGVGGGASTYPGGVGGDASPYPSGGVGGGASNYPSGDYHPPPPPQYAAPKPPTSSDQINIMYPTPNAGAPPSNPHQQQQHQWNDVVKVPLNPQPGVPQAPPSFSDLTDDHIYEVPPSPSASASGNKPHFPEFPEPPSDFFPAPPSGRPQHPGSSKPHNNQPKDGNDLDFDDLARRFDELKKKL